MNADALLCGLRPQTSSNGFGVSPATTAGTASTAVSVGPTIPACSAAELDGSRVGGIALGCEDYISGSAAAATTSAIGGSRSSPPPTYINRAREVDRFADQDDRTTAISSNSSSSAVAIAAALTTRTAPHRPKASLAEQCVVLRQNGGVSRFPISPARCSSVSRIHNRKAAICNANFAHCSANSAATTAATRTPEVAVD
jgi:hypothetical protein